MRRIVGPIGIGFLLTVLSSVVFAGDRQAPVAQPGLPPAACSTATSGVADQLAKIANAEGVRFLILGEIHGTMEIPRLVAEAACAISRARPVVVALEIHTQAQADVDAYLGSDGASDARNALLEGPAWALRTADGRSSLAMFDLIEALRKMRQQGAPIDVVATRAFAPEGLPQAYSEIMMAAAWTEAAGRRPDGLVLALVGRVHAAKVPNSRLKLRPAAELLPKDSTVALGIGAVSGSFWGCGTDDCGPQDLPQLPTSPEIGVMLDAEDPLFDGRFVPSLQLTASPPARKAALQ